MPLDWATAENGLGAALAALGERASGKDRLEEAVDAFRAALKEGRASVCRATIWWPQLVTLMVGVGSLMAFLTLPAWWYALSVV